MLETCGSASGGAYLPGDRVGLSSRPALERRSGRYAHVQGSADRIVGAVPCGRCAGGFVTKITDDLEELLAFYDYPAQHWVHLRTTNPIESTFATVRHRTKITRGPGSKAAGLAMAFKLIMAAA